MSDDNLTFERAKGVPHAGDGPFEPADEDPEKPEKRKRVSTALLDLVNALENDFAYQYSYNQDLIQQLAKEKAASAAAKADAENRLSQARQTIAAERNAGVDAQHELGKAQVAMAELELENARLSSPSRLWRRIALTGWTLLLLVAGVLAYEKITNEPIDELWSRVIIGLSSDE